MTSDVRSKSGLALAGFVVVLAAGFASAGMLLVDYTRPAPIFCEAGAGCQALRESAFSHVGGVPLPVIGSLGFALLTILALGRGERMRRAFLAVAGLASVAAVALIGVQVALHTFCKFCLVVDTSVLLLFAGAVVRFRSGWDPPASIARTVGAGVIGMAATIPLIVGVTTTPPPPPAAIDRPAETPLSIQAELLKTPKGIVTIIDFADYECPFCRRMHESLKGLLADHSKQVRLVRKQVPLDAIHPHAHDAARGAICGEKLGHGDEMADKLFEAPVDELTPASIGEMAASLGIDRSAFDKCVADPATEQVITIDKTDFQIAAGRGLPLLWIDAERMIGVRSRQDLEGAFQRALASDPRAAIR